MNEIQVIRKANALRLRKQLQRDIKSINAAQKRIKELKEALARG